MRRFIHLKALSAWWVMVAMVALAAALTSRAVLAITLTPIATGFNNPIGIDHHEPTNRVVLSVNYSTGFPHNFELVAADGTRQQFSAIAGFTDEVKIATAKDDGGGASMGGFTSGELFTGTGVPGVIARISANGGSVQNPWVTLPGETGLMRGSLYVDRTGVFAGDLIVVTTAGGVWRVTAGGSPTKLASLGTHLEGVVTVPNDPSRYGPWAGKILAGAEGQGRIYSIAPDGTTAFYTLGINPEDIDIVPSNQNFFGVDFSGQTLWGAAAAQWTSLVGDFVIAQEFPGILWHVRWNGTDFDAEELVRVAQWEHVTFSTAGVPCVPPVCSITGDTEICEGETAELCGPEAQGATYGWTGPHGFAANTRCIRVGVGGTYVLTITVPCQGSDPVSSSCTTSVAVNALPACPITGPDAICQGENATLCGPTGDFTYQWSTGATTRCITTSSSGTYTLTVTDRSTDCRSTCSHDLTVHPLPPCTIAGPDSICPGDTANLCGPAGNFGYSWSTGATTQCITIATPGLYTLTVTDHATDCHSTCSYTVRPGVCNLPPDCSQALACEAVLWPPNHKYRAISICGVTDPEGDPVTITVTRVTQDEPINTRGDGNTCPDAQIVDGQASVRAERTGTPGIPGNGRVYQIHFTADDGRGGTCEGRVTVCVPHDQSDPTCIDDGQRYSSTGPCTNGNIVAPETVTLNVGEVTPTHARFTFALPADVAVNMSVYDVTGRRLATIENGRLPAGVHERSWNVSRLANGLYFVRLRAGDVTVSRMLVRVQ